jgi:hypothetical protein
VLVFAVQRLHQISKAGFGSINPAKGFRLLQAEASHPEVTLRGLQLVQYMVDCVRNLALFGCPHVYLSNLSGGLNPKIVQPLAGPKLRDYPTWLLAAASPSL